MLGECCRALLIDSIKKREGRGDYGWIEGNLAIIAFFLVAVPKKNLSLPAVWPIELMIPIFFGFNFVKTFLLSRVIYVWT